MKDQYLVNTSIDWEEEVILIKKENKVVASIYFDKKDPIIINIQENFFKRGLLELCLNAGFCGYFANFPREFDFVSHSLGFKINISNDSVIVKELILHKNVNKQLQNSLKLYFELLSGDKTILVINDDKSEYWLKLDLM